MQDAIRKPRQGAGIDVQVYGVSHNRISEPFSMQERYLVSGQSLRRPTRFILPLALLCNILIDVLVISKDKYEVPLGQFLLGSDELLHSHRIFSTFLPVGYPILLAMAFSVGQAFHIGQHGGFYVLSVALSSCLLLLIYQFLRYAGVSERVAALSALLICVYPELLHNLSKISDTNITAVLLLGIAVCAVNLLREQTFTASVWFGITLGSAILVRPNLVLLVALLWVCFDSMRRLAAWKLAAVAVGMAGLVFAGATAAVHGSPFFPKNGPYNMFAGNNPHSARALITGQNAEGSILPALKDFGIVAVMNWNVPSEQPGIQDARDLVYAQLYSRETKRFMLQHPGQIASLCALKLWTFLAPETNRYNFHSRMTPSVIAWLALKCASALIVPLWCCLLIVQKRKSLGMASKIVIATAVLYTLPFVIVNSDPRFRAPLAVLLLADSVRIAYGLLRSRGGQQTSDYFTSLPRPAA